MHASSRELDACGIGFVADAHGRTSRSIVTAALDGLANLAYLGCQDHLCDDNALRHIASLPKLRMLMGQGTVATDEGFRSLSQSQTIEYFWGRECPNLNGPGFVALSRMPA